MRLRPVQTRSSTGEEKSQTGKATSVAPEAATKTQEGCRQQCLQQRYWCGANLSRSTTAATAKFFTYNTAAEKKKAATGKYSGYIHEQTIHGNVDGMHKNCHFEVGLNVALLQPFRPPTLSHSPLSSSLCTLSAKRHSRTDG